MPQKRKPYKTYSKEFKIEAVRLTRKTVSDPIDC